MPVVDSTIWIEASPEDVVAVLLDVVDRLVEQDLVGLLRVVRDRVVVGRTAAAGGQEQTDQGEGDGKAHCEHDLTLS